MVFCARLKFADNLSPIAVERGMARHPIAENRVNQAADAMYGVPTGIVNNRRDGIHPVRWQKQPQPFIGVDSALDYQPATEKCPPPTVYGGDTEGRFSLRQIKNRNNRIMVPRVIDLVDAQAIIVAVIGIDMLDMRSRHQVRQCG